MENIIRWYIVNSCMIKHVLQMEKKEGHVLFNDAFNTFCLRLYDIRHVVKDQIEKKPTFAT